MREVPSFNNTPPSGRSYHDHLRVHFRDFLKGLGGGSLRVVRCHPAILFMVDAAGCAKPVLDPDMPEGEGAVAGRRFRVENLH